MSEAAVHANDASLTKREHAFVLAYISLGPVKGRTEKAAVQAGYSSHSARQSGAKLLQKATVLACVREAEAKMLSQIEERQGITKAWVINNLEKIVKRCMEMQPVMFRHGGTDYPCNYSRMVDALSAIKALALIGKHLGMFNTRPEPVEAPFNLLINLGGGPCPHCGADTGKKPDQNSSASSQSACQSSE